MGKKESNPRPEDVGAIKPPPPPAPPKKRIIDEDLHPIKMIKRVLGCL